MKKYTEMIHAEYFAPEILAIVHLIVLPVLLAILMIAVEKSTFAIISPLAYIIFITSLHVIRIKKGTNSSYNVEERERNNYNIQKSEVFFIGLCFLLCGGGFFVFLAIAL